MDEPRTLARAGVRDAIAGALLAWMSLWVGRPAILHPEDPLAWLFDALALAWVVWGVTRALRHGAILHRALAGIAALAFVVVMLVGVVVRMGRS
ncbi:MAG: hypothetical protein IT378_04100 [Sandaracinaceae bacterium]|nr:hypothetical protein [Sandaracinaceae bacterium]